MTGLVTRQPTGKPPWPITLLAGGEKCGKSWACAVASGSPLIGRTLWVGVGEDDPDEYGAIPGAAFEIVQHDGTYRSILNALTACAEQPDVDGKPVLIVLDSATRLWDLLCDEAQREANDRAARKASRARQAPPDDDVQITMDLWNVAKSRWQHLLDTFRDHTGPSLITARLDEVTVLDARGNPTKDKALKVKAEKGLPYDVGVIVEFPELGEAYIRGVRSVRLQLTERKSAPDFTVHRLWEQLGLAEAGATAPRQHAAVHTVNADGFTDEQVATIGEFAELIPAADDTDALRALYEAMPEYVQKTLRAPVAERKAALAEQEKAA